MKPQFGSNHFLQVWQEILNRESLANWWIPAQDLHQVVVSTHRPLTLTVNATIRPGVLVGQRFSCSKDQWHGLAGNEVVVPVVRASSHDCFLLISNSFYLCFMYLPVLLDLVGSADTQSHCHYAYTDIATILKLRNCCSLMFTIILRFMYLDPLARYSMMGRSIEMYFNLL